MRILAFLFALLFSFAGFAQTSYMFVGTYTGSGSKGIYVYRFNGANGELELVSSTDGIAGLENPSFLALSPNRKYVYAVNETGGSSPGKVSAFSFDEKTGQLSFLNQQPTGGDHPCYVSVSQDGAWAVVGNYNGGNVSVFPLNSDGSLKPFAQLVQHTGSSVTKGRQDKAHVHAAVFSPDYRFVFTPDLGMDQVRIYRFDPKAAQPLKEASPAFAPTEGGTGPRHFVFHPTGKYAYLMEELSGAVSAYRYKNGKLDFLQRLSSHPEGYSGTIGSADIHVTQDGKFLYASNRGDANTIALFVIDPATGRLQFRGVESTGGKTPRNFTLDPSGNYLLAANQESDNVVVFKRDPQSGVLTATGKEARVPKPVCLLFFPGR